MSFTNKDFDNPLDIFDIRTRKIRVRIQNLQKFLIVAQHPFTKAVVEQELNNLVDEYVTRTIQRRNTTTN